MKKHEELLLALLAATVDYDISRCKTLLPADEETWTKLLVLAGEQGVTGLVFSAVEHLPKQAMPPTKQLMQLFGQTEYQKAHYQSQLNTAEKFAVALREKGVEMKVLKGISFSTYYDQPNLRECGDCDCYLSLKETVSRNSGASEGAATSTMSAFKAGSTGFETGNKVIEEIGGRAEFGTYKHSHLFLDKLMFENHHYVTDFQGTKLGKKTELLLERAIEGEPGTPITLTLDNKTFTTALVRPCAHFCALHCLRHAQGNLMLSGMVLRMLYDWAMIMRAEQDNLDWERLGKDLDEMRLRPFAGVMTSACERYLGLKVTTKDVIRCEDDALVREVMLDTLRHGNHLRSGETILEKSFRILKRFWKMYHFRQLAAESVPMMIWNCFAFSSYMHRNITLED